MAAFTLSGSDFYEDVMSRFCIISSGNNSVQDFNQDFNLLRPGAWGRTVYAIKGREFNPLSTKSDQH